jgi:putative ABC transport system permease protein
VTVVVRHFGGQRSYVTPATLDRLAAAGVGATADPVQWVTLVAFTPGASPSDVVDQIDEALASISHWTSSPAAERDFMEQVIDTILAVIVGLLAVAVLIALIGVANTLALSVLERRRESATLRALGLSKRQLRSMLAIEGTFIAGVGAVLGVVLGLLYGWAGSWIVLNLVGDVHLAMPWRDVAIVIGVAVVAGLVASVAPARSATRTSPVEALTVE